MWGDGELNLPGERKVSTATAWTLQSMHLVCCTNSIIHAIDMFDKHLHSPDNVTCQWETAESFCLVASWPNPTFYFLAWLFSRTFPASLLIWWTDSCPFLFKSGKYYKMGMMQSNGMDINCFLSKSYEDLIKHCPSQPKISFYHSCWVNCILVLALLLSKHLASTV